MIPIHELINRIRWDADFGNADFVIGYYDRVKKSIAHIAFREIAFPPGEHFSFVIVDDEGGVHNIPLHRIRELYRDGILIWTRHSLQDNASDSKEV